MYLIYRTIALGYPLTEINFIFRKTLGHPQSNKSFLFFNYLTNQTQGLNLKLKIFIFTKQEMSIFFKK